VKLIQYQAFLFFARSTFAAPAQNFLLLPLLFLRFTMLSLRKSRDYSGRFAKVKDPPAETAARTQARFVRRILSSSVTLRLTRCQSNQGSGRSGT
jgi:hypothetical protein